MTKILYIDDEPINLLIFKTLFEKKYDVITGLSGIEGLDILQRYDDISVVISDMQMPEMDGIEFIEKARQLYPNTKFSILTGYDITPKIKEAIDSEIICNYFQKPFNFADIDSKISL